MEENSFRDKTKNELEEAIKQSMIIGAFIAVGLIILTMIINGILYYNMLVSFLIPFYKSFEEQSTEIFLERRILTNKISTDLFLHITNFNFFIIAIIFSIIMFLSYTLSILEEPNLNQKINEQKLKYYSQIIKTYFWPGALVWKIIGIIIVMYYVYIFDQIYPIIQQLPILK
jgi:putative flippase GtrA